MSPSPDRSERSIDEPREIVEAGAESATQVEGSISQAAVRLYVRAFGPGQPRAETYIRSDFAVCLMRNVLTPEERALIENGRREQVEGSRKRGTGAIEGEFVELVEREVGRPVQTHLAHVRVFADIVLHFFLFDDAGDPVPG